MIVDVDLLITKTIDPISKEPILDFTSTEEGCLQELYAENAVKQRAVLISSVQKGTIPQLPEVGVEWTEFITGQVSPAEINSQIMDVMHRYADTYNYVPKYETENDRLVVTIEENK